MKKIIARLKQLILVLLAIILLGTLSPWQMATAASSNLISNPSVETVGSTANRPQDWTPNSWGINTAKFEYLSTGHIGNKSVKTTLSNYLLGDAKWYFKPVAVAAGKKYTYSTYYQSSISSEVIVQITHTTGLITYQTLKSAPRSASWAQVSVDVTMPATAKAASIFHVINKNGWLQTDDGFFGLTSVTPPAPVAPTVSIAAPATGSTVSGTVAVSATAASSGSSVAGVQFKVDDTNVGSEVTAAPYTYSWDTTKVANGSYALTATVRSANGLSTTSSAVNVTVNNVIVTPPTDTDNIIPNNSVETANGATPLNWSSNAWGTNSASFTYANTGHTGSRSLTTTLTSWTSGDAKWFFDPVAVTAGKTYLYRDYYKSNVTQRVVVAFLDSSGSYTYKELSTTAPSSDWNQYQDTFDVPAGVVKASVYHLIDSVGSLTIDDALLQVAPAVAPTTIPNGSVETGGTAPTGWTSSSWGTNSPTFQYVNNDGYTGNKSVKVTMNSYTDGDAKWYFNPIKTLAPGKQYRFNVNYKTNVTPKAVAMYIKADGTEQYFGMPNPFSNGTGNWQSYSETFTVPTDAVQVSAFLFINEVGYLQTDNYSITDYQPTGFSRPLLTLTFDDGEEDNTTTVLPLLDQYGFKSTQCFATTFIEGNQAAVNNIKTIQNHGHEICSHTVTHPFLTQDNAADLDYELKHAQDYLQSITGQPVVDFASPYGDYNETVNNAIKKYYQAHRTVDEGFNSKDNFDPYRLRVQNILDTTSANQITSWIQQAQANNTWLILVYHRVASSDIGPYDTPVSAFPSHLAAIKASGIAVETMKDALAETKAQL
jgi:peptidoglycan/xylan/chitin deacetylase (PgdA/CDA1 family)